MRAGRLLIALSRAHIPPCCAQGSLIAWIALVCWWDCRWSIGNDGFEYATCLEGVRPCSVLLDSSRSGGEHVCFASGKVAVGLTGSHICRVRAILDSDESWAVISGTYDYGPLSKRLLGDICLSRLLSVLMVTLTRGDRHDDRGREGGHSGR